MKPEQRKSILDTLSKVPFSQDSKKESIYTDIKLKIPFHWNTVQQEDEQRHVLAERTWEKEQEAQRERERLEQIQKEQEELRVALEKEALRKRVIAISGGVVILGLLAFLSMQFLKPEDSVKRLELTGTADCHDKEAMRFVLEDGEVLCHEPSPVRLERLTKDKSFQEKINFLEHSREGQERTYLLPGDLNLQQFNAYFESEFWGNGVMIELKAVDESQLLSIRFDTSLFDLATMDRIVLQKSDFPDLSLDQISINLSGENRDLDGDGIPASDDSFPFDSLRCGDADDDGQDDCSPLAPNDKNIDTDSP